MLKDYFRPKRKKLWIFWGHFGASMPIWYHWDKKQNCKFFLQKTPFVVYIHLKQLETWLGRDTISKLCQNTFFAIIFDNIMLLSFFFISFSLVSRVSGEFTTCQMVNLLTTSGTSADAELASSWAALRFFLTEKFSIDTILVLYYSCVTV